ncbi:MAG: hypothetical protein FWE88_03100 [Phycisphaerae bacterium]|nr:hypothetical protein [Phycisphaerae bacterium]
MMGFDAQHGRQEPPSELTDADIGPLDDSDDLAFEPLDEFPPLPDLDAPDQPPVTTEPSFAAPAPSPTRTPKYQNNIPNYEEMAKPSLTGKEVLMYMVMIGVLAGVAWWVTQELKQLTTMKKAQASVKINTNLLPKNKPAIPPAHKKVVPQSEPPPATNGLKGLASQLAAIFGYGKGKESEEACAKHQEMLADLSRISPETPWMNRAAVLLAARTPVAVETPDPLDAFFEDPFAYGIIRLNQLTKKPVPAKSSGGSGSAKTVARAKPFDGRPLLSAIMIVDGQPTAIVNNRNVRVGDNVDGMRVLRIDTFSVTLDANGGELTLRL